MNSKIDLICTKLLNSIKKIIETQDINDDYITLENKFEESIMLMLDEYVNFFILPHLIYRVLIANVKKRIMN